MPDSSKQARTTRSIDDALKRLREHPTARPMTPAERDPEGQTRATFLERGAAPAKSDG